MAWQAVVKVGHGLRGTEPVLGYLGVSFRDILGDWPWHAVPLILLENPDRLLKPSRLSPQ
jgi:hypothetical protein